MKIGVFGNCDTGGMTATLTRLLPEHEIIPVVRPADADAGWYQSLRSKVDKLAVNSAIYKRDKASLDETGLDIVAYPQLIFTAFHPDCCYVGIKQTGALIVPDYNSAICMGCYINGIPVESVAQYFTGDVYAQLGYLDAWDASVTRTQAQFAECGFEFRRFHLAIKRTGAFMHSMNHPKIGAIIAIGRLLAVKLGASEQAASQPLELSDGLANLNWPLYPEIAEIYGLRGDYVWNRAGVTLDKEGFIAASYQRYRELGLTRDTVFFGTPEFHNELNKILDLVETV